jgi:acetyl-CoA C-acetyltransferase
MGGQKARGNPLARRRVPAGRSGAAAARQAGKNQVAGARRALVQGLGGPAATAVTHVLERMP